MRDFLDGKILVKLEERTVRFIIESNGKIPHTVKWWYKSDESTVSTDTILTNGSKTKKKKEKEVKNPFDEFTRIRHKGLSLIFV